MELLKPDFSQKKPTSVQARAMCQQVRLETRSLTDPRVDSVLNRIRETHTHGGVLFTSFHVGPSEAFDWFASRNRLFEFGILRQLLERKEISDALPALKIEPSSPNDPAFVVKRLGDHGPVDPALLAYGIGDDFEVGQPEYDGNFQETSPFLFDGQLAQTLYYGGAYTKVLGDGSSEKQNSLSFCDALFGLRLSEVCYCSSHSAWTPWFANIAWDWTAILFDLRLRALSILAITDSD